MSTSGPSGRRTRQAYPSALERCSTQHAPWFVIPSDRKWYRNWAVAQLLVEHLRALNLQWPVADFDVEAEKAAGRRPIAEPATADQALTTERCRTGAEVLVEIRFGQRRRRRSTSSIADDHVAGQGHLGDLGLAAHRRRHGDRAGLERQLGLTGVEQSGRQEPAADGDVPTALGPEGAHRLGCGRPGPGRERRDARQPVVGRPLPRPAGDQGVAADVGAAGRGEDQPVQLADPPRPQRVAQPPVDDRQQLGLRADRPRGGHPQVRVGGALIWATSVGTSAWAWNASDSNSGTNTISVDAPGRPAC